MKGLDDLPVRLSLSAKRSGQRGEVLGGSFALAHQTGSTRSTRWLEFSDDVAEVAQVGGNWSFPVQFFNQAECPAFGCTWDSTNYSGTKNTNRAQTTTQAFYYVNHFHDHLLAAPIGFDEASRNFEFVNSSGQGLGGDPVEVVTNHHNFSLRNNASFQWATEGTSPILRTGMFDTPYDVNSRMEGLSGTHRIGSTMNTS
jgi:hypothetical protein